MQRCPGVAENILVLEPLFHIRDSERLLNLKHGILKDDYLEVMETEGTGKVLRAVKGPLYTRLCSGFCVIQNTIYKIS